MADKVISIRATPGVPAVPSGQTKRKPPVKKALEEEEFTEVRPDTDMTHYVSTYMHI